MEVSTKQLVQMYHVHLMWKVIYLEVQAHVGAVQT